MKAADFRKLALSLPETEESAHMNHPDFRVGGKIFATLGPDEDWGMVKLTPVQQAAFMDSHDGFAPASGKWGERGATIVTLAESTRGVVGEALVTAWRNTAPKKVLAEHDV